MRKTLRTDSFDDEYQTDVCDGSLAALQDANRQLIVYYY